MEWINLVPEFCHHLAGPADQNIVQINLGNLYIVVNISTAGSNIRPRLKHANHKADIRTCEFALSLEEAKYGFFSPPFCRPDLLKPLPLHFALSEGELQCDNSSPASQFHSDLMP
jgi:hypothetical protein